MQGADRRLRLTPPCRLQIAQSCTLLGMAASLGPCGSMAHHPEAAAGSGPARDFCITTADKALEGEWWLVVRLLVRLHDCLFVPAAPGQKGCMLLQAATTPQQRSACLPCLPHTARLPSPHVPPCAAVRGGWRGQPLVVLGRREDLPLNLQPLATTVRQAWGAGALRMRPEGTWCMRRYTPRRPLPSAR